MKTDAQRVAGFGLDPHRFVFPDFERPFNVADELAGIPATATVRGMFIGMINDIARELIGRVITTDDPLAFGTVSMRAYVELLAKAAREIYPNVPTREGIRRLGQRVFSGFYDTMVGKAIFAIAGRDFDRLAQLAPKAYEVSYSPCSVRTTLVAPGRVHVVFEPMYVLPESFHIGAWEDAAKFSGGSLRVLHTRPTKAGHMEYDLTYLKGASGVHSRPGSNSQP